MDSVLQHAHQATPAPTNEEAYRRFRQVVHPYPLGEEDPVVEALARRAQQGDLAARDALYARLADQVLGLAMAAWARAGGCPGGRMEAADLRQEAFLGFCDLLRDWQPARLPFGAYLGATLPRRLWHAVRAVRRPREVAPPALPPEDAADDAASAPLDPACAPDPADLYAARERCAALLAPLSRRERLVLIRHLIEGHSLPELAARLGVGERQLGRVYRDALRALREGR